MNSDRILYFVFQTKIVILVALLLIFIRFFTYNPESVLIQAAEKEVSIVGKIVSEPDKRENSLRLVVLPRGFNEKILVTTSRYPEYEYGDFVKIRGTIQLPKNFSNDTGIEFDYVNFLAKEKIFTLMYRPNIIRFDHSTDNLLADKYFSLTITEKVSKKLFRVKNNFIQSVNRSVSSPESELIAGILLGTKQSLGKELEDQFRRVGLIHIVVLSGYNVTIIIQAVLFMMFFLPIGLKVLFGIISIFIFSLVVGQGATVVRAGVMAAIGLSASFFHRRYNVNRALFVAGYLMVFINPKIILYDPSFQLSFMATWGLINIGEKIGDLLKFIPEKFGFRELFVATVSTQIAVLPLLAKMTGEISIISLPVNLITLPLIPISMLLGFVAGAAGMINEFAGLLFGIFPYLSLCYVIFITKTAAGFSFATAMLPKISNLLILFYYGLLIIILHYSPIQIFKKIIYVLRFTRGKIIGHK